MWTVRKKLGITLLLFLLLVIFGMFGYRYLEGWSFLDSIYMTIITIATIGFGETHPLDTKGKIFTIFLIIVGLGGATYFFSLLSKTILEGELHEYFGRKKMQGIIDKLENHIIICGFGRFGSYIAKEFSRQNVSFVIIEKDENIFKTIETQGYWGILGDSTDDEVLINAGIKKASCLVSVASTDAENLYITVTARQINPKIYIVTRSQEDSAEKKMIRAGANKIVSTYKLGANQLAQSALRPTVIDFIEIATQSRNLEFTIEEIKVPAESKTIKKSLKELSLSRILGVIIIGIKRNEKMLFNPSADTMIEANDILIALGSPEQLKKLSNMVNQ